MGKEELTQAEHEALVSFARLLKKNPHPTVQEWADSLKPTRHFSTLKAYQRTLKAKGLITAQPGRARTTQLTAKGQAYLKRSKKK